MLRRHRERGYPTSSNRASSFHLWWLLDAAADAVEVTLEVLEPPLVPRLYFWALQVSFVDVVGPGPPVARGGGHVGLQWHPSHPGSTAVNWGGYDASGAVLDGSESELRSTTGNPHTRDYSWYPGRPYRLRVEPGREPGWWRGSITDLGSGDRTIVRELRAGGSRLASPVVWSEVFARCDDPPVAIRWSAPMMASDGESVRPQAARVTYQTYTDGGCSNTDVIDDGTGIVQATNRVRTVDHGAVIGFPGGNG